MKKVCSICGNRECDGVRHIYYNAYRFKKEDFIILSFVDRYGLFTKEIKYKNFIESLKGFLSVEEGTNVFWEIEYRKIITHKDNVEGIERIVKEELGEFNIIVKDFGENIGYTSYGDIIIVEADIPGEVFWMEKVESVEY